MTRIKISILVLFISLSTMAGADDAGELNFALFEAAKTGDKAQVRLLLDKGNLALSLAEWPLF